MTLPSFETHIQDMMNMIDFFLNQIKSDQEINLDSLEPMMSTLEKILTSSSFKSPLLKDLHLKLELLTKTLQSEQKMIQQDIDSLHHHSQGVGRYISTQYLVSSQ